MCGKGKTFIGKKGLYLTLQTHRTIFNQSYCRGLTAGRSGCSALLHMAAWKSALNTCCMKASLVGGWVGGTLKSGAEISLWLAILDIQTE